MHAVTKLITKARTLLSRPEPGLVSAPRIAAISFVTAILAVTATFTGNAGLATIVGLPAYLLLPGFLLQLATRRKLELGLNTFLYSAGLSLIFWLLGALALNTILPPAHVTKPLELRYLLSLYASAIIGLNLVALRSNASLAVRIDRTASRPNSLVIAGAVAIPVLSVLGATTLNNGGPGTLTVTMLAACVLYVLGVGIFFKRFNQGLYPAAIYGLGLALLLMYSMRSWHVLGWDIHQELLVFTKTLALDHWSMSSFPGLDYNACLSITILPTVLTKLFHTAPEYVFKLLYQIMFALVPVAVYAVARRYLLPVLSFLAAVLFVGQTWFFELMPALARQEIAILFFALFLLVLTDNAITRATRRLFLYTFATGIILSHYSTAYLWITMCVFAYLVLWIIRLISATARRDVRGLTWPLIAASIAMLWLWEGPATNTAGQTGSTFSNFGTQMNQAFSPATIAKALHAVIVGPTPQSGAVVTAANNQAYHDRPGNVYYYAPSSYASYTPVLINANTTSGNALPGPLSTALRIVIAATRAITNNLITAIGIVMVSFYFLRRSHKSNLDFVALCLGAYFLIFLVLMMPYLQQVYNLPRVGLQSFTLLVVPIIAGFWFVVRRNIKWGIPIIALVVGLSLAGQSGLIDHFTGGTRRITMDARGTSDSYYVSDDEIASARWLSANRAPHVPIFADPVAKLRLTSYGDPSSIVESVWPDALPMNSYVYLADQSTKYGYSYYTFHNDTLTYNTPTQFLNSNKDLLYIAGGSRVYH